ncbi:TetR/AcrR family transcriptional regulator [Streptomyces asoensis]|uniref:TetR family transcriptional regulator n=1 Tax=Streptomyces asoensis TaxID=249586 RepID=A0ABQ3SCS0_9ACTN|nr:TetR family transcriptional regulator [Streptomyces asoensis]GHI65827.1 TetR family transcriptional regulator [Streptomyces asoensis]
MRFVEEGDRIVDRAKTRGPYAKTAARRAEIVRAARACFAEHGYANSSLRTIAERAGITHAGLLHHFRDKDELLAEVLAQRDSEEWRQGLEEVEGIDQLGSYLAGLIQRHQRAPELMRLWIELAAAASRPDHPAHTYFVERYELSRAQFVEGLPNEAARTRLREGVSPESAAVLFQAVLNGLQLQWVLQQDLDVVGPVTDFVRLLFAQDDDAGDTA